MMDVWQSAVEGFHLVFSWPNIIYPIAGTLLAMFFSAMPGLGGAMLKALAIAFTFRWEPLPVMLLFGALVGGATFMGSVTGILFNIPGQNASVATMLDGYPMARQGRAKTAIGCSATASALGSTFGVFVLIAMIPIMRQAILAFGPAELLILAIWGLTTIAAVSRESMMKGLIAAGAGLMLAYVGQDPRTAEARYTFGSLYLLDGLGLVPVFLGIFALAEIVELLVSRRDTISGLSRADALKGSVWEGCRSVFTHWWLLLRSSAIGTVIGIIPGVGATVASFVAYGHAAQTSRDSDDLGHGDIRGVLAPEAANDAKDGGSLVPTLAFGIPGGVGTALLLGALEMHGLVPGREMLSNDMTLIFVLV
jgi:TctA family transporter